MRPKAIFNWSTGKDSALALHKIRQSGACDIGWLLTSVNAHYDRVSMHGVRTELLEAQAASLGVPLIQVRLPEAPSMEAYEQAMGKTLGELKAAGATHSIFGDIFLEDLRAYREQKLATLGFEAVFPLWQIPTTHLVREVIDLGFKAITTCVNDRWLGQEFAGRLLDDAFLRELPEQVDPCGENGEFHTFSYDGPIFSRPVDVTVGEIIHRRYAAAPTPASTTDDEDRETYTCGPSTATQSSDRPAPIEAGFWYCDLLPAPA